MKIKISINNDISLIARAKWHTVLAVADNLIVPDEMHLVSLSVSFHLDLLYKLFVSFSLFKRPFRANVDRSEPIN